MEVNLVRAPSGSVVFLEANSEFADMLARLLQAPLGSLLQSCSKSDASGQEHPLLSLAASFAQLRDAIFHDKKTDVLPKALSWDRLFKGKGQEMDTRSPPECLMCLKFEGAKRPLQQSGLGAGCGHPLSPHFSELLPGHLCAKCASCGCGAQHMSDDRTCFKCGKRSVRTCDSCFWCDACGIRELGLTAHGIPEEVLAANTFREEAKFLLTDSMELVEASSSKAVELMSHASENLKHITASSVQVSPSQMRELISRGLGGSRHALTETFTQKEAFVERGIGCEAEWEAPEHGDEAFAFEDEASALAEAAKKRRID